MKLALLLLFTLINLTRAENECDYPWQKVDDNICLFLNSYTKTWSHAKFLCNFYGGELLYVQNETEQIKIQNYLSKLIKYRFNKKQFVWLDSIDRYNEGEWIWSRNNDSIQYSNWINKRKPTINSNSNDLNCACFRLKDGSWKDCDCLLSQHFVCRKSDKNINLNIVLASTTTTTTTTTEPTTISSIERLIKTEPIERHDFFLDSTVTTDNFQNFNYDTTTSPISNEEEEDDYDEQSLKKNNVLNIEEVEDKRIIISTRVLMNDEDKLKQQIIKSISERNNTIELEIDSNQDSKTELKLLKAKKTTKQYSPVNALRIVVEKELSTFTTYFCPLGLGYYLEPGSNCEKYRICENWDQRYAIFSQFECGKSKIFSLKSLKCVSQLRNRCDLNQGTFIAIN